MCYGGTLRRGARLLANTGVPGRSYVHGTRSPIGGGRERKERVVFSAYISTRPGAGTEFVLTEAEPQYIADLVELLKVAFERRRCEIDALAQHGLFGDGEEVR